MDAVEFDDQEAFIFKGLQKGLLIAFFTSNTARGILRKISGKLGQSGSF